MISPFSSLPRPGRVLLSVVLAAALNCVHFDLIGGAEFRFGALVAMPFVLALPRTWAVAFALLSVGPMVALRGNVCILALTGLEAIWLVTIGRRWRYPALADLLFWIVGGIPLGVGMYVTVNAMPAADAVVLLVNQSLSGLFAVLFAEGVVRSRHFAKWLDIPPTVPAALRGLIFNTVFLLAAVPLVLMAIGVSLLLRNAAAQRERAHLDQALSEVDRQIDLQLRSHRSAVLAIARVAEKQSGSGVSVLLEEVRRAYPGFVSMVTTDASGRVQEMAPTIDWLHGAEIRDREYFRAARDRGVPVISGVFRGRGFGDDVLIAINVPMRRPDGSFGGVVEGSLAVSQFNAVLIRSSLPQDVSIIVTDSAGRVILADQSTGLSPLDKINPGEAAAMLATIADTRVVTIELPVANGATKEMHARALTGELGYSVIAVRSGTGGLDQLLAIYLLLIGVVATVLAAAVWVASVASRRIAVPLEHFARDAVDQAESGALTAMATPGGPMPREIAMVFAAFNCLAARVCETHAALVDSNTRLDARVAERTRELQLAQERAEAASRSKTDFVAMTGHEIRTPLNAIIGLAETVGSAMSPGPIADRVHTIHRAGVRLLGVVNDLLDLSRVEAGKLELQLAPVELGAMITEVMTLFESQARQQQLILESEVRVTLPLWIEMDTSRMQQVLINLVGNALKFTGRGSVRLQVRVEGEQDGKVTLRFAVIDTGPGISPSEQARLFQPYVQLGAPGEPRTKGTGLGLSISRRLAELFGGGLAVISKAGHGAEFHFTATFRRVAAKIAVVDRSVDDLRGVRVLVADDNVANQEVMRAFLEPIGADIEVVDTARDAIDRLTIRAFDVALIDLEMPDESGTAVAHAMAAQDPMVQSTGCRLIAVSAHARQDKHAECIAQGFEDYLAKPINRQDLMCILRASVGSEKVRRQHTRPAA